MSLVDLINLRSPNDSWHPICSDGWDESWSDLVCSQLGYAGQEDTRATLDTSVDSLKFWHKKTGVSITPEPVQLFEDKNKGKECKSREKINLECQQFGRQLQSIG